MRRRLREEFQTTEQFVYRIIFYKIFENFVFCSKFYKVFKNLFLNFLFWRIFVDQNSGPLVMTDPGRKSPPYPFLRSLIAPLYGEFVYISAKNVCITKCAHWRVAYISKYKVSTAYIISLNKKIKKNYLIVYFL